MYTSAIVSFIIFWVYNKFFRREPKYYSKINLSVLAEIAKIANLFNK